MENNIFTILLIDDEPDIIEFLSYNLRKEGYKVLSANNAKTGIAIAVKEKPHLIILDVMMPGMDGMEACTELKQIPELQSTLITFLTARSEDYSQIAGFGAGADDYISKPIKPKIFLSKIKALLRRYQKNVTPSSNLLEIGQLTIDKERYLVTWEDNEFALPKKEFELLLLLATKPNKVFTRDEIFANVWGNNVIVGDRTIDVHVRKIREKLKTIKIKTIKGVGYKYEI